MARTTTRSQKKETLSQFTARLKKKRAVELAQGRESVKRRRQEREISKIEKQVAGLGFTRADISEVRPDLFTRERTELVRGKITRTKTAPSRQLSRLEQKAFKRQFKKVNIVDKSGKGGTFFVKKDALTKAEEKTKQRIPTTIVRGTPSGEQIVRLLAKQRTPERDKTITAERIITARAKEKIKAKPSTDITLKGLGKVVVRDVKKVTDFASEKISQSGLGKALNAVDALNEIKLKEAKAEKAKLRSKTTLTAKDKRKLFLLNAKIGARSGTDVSVEFVKDFFNRPVQNAALFGIGAGAQKILGKVGLKVVGLKKTAPTTAKALKALGVTSGAGLLGLYATGVIKEAQEEIKTKGTVTETTAKALRELVVLGAGAQAGKSVKTAKLTELQKIINKSPKSQRVKLQKQFNKIAKLTEKELLTKDIGKITKLESQQIVKSIGDGRIVKRTVTVTKDSLFSVKKGRAPKRAKQFEMVITKFKGSARKGFSSEKAVEQTVLAKFNPRTKKVEIVKVLSTKPLSPNVAKTKFKQFQKGQTQFVKTRQVPVRGSERTIKKVKTIQQIKSKEPFKSLKKTEILSKKAYNKRFGKDSNGVFVENVDGSTNIFIKDTIGAKDSKFLTKSQMNNIFKNSKKIQNVFTHEVGHKLDLKSVNRPIFDGVKNIKTNEKFLKYVKRLHKKGLIENDVGYYISNYKPNKVPLEIRAELYKTFIKNPNKLKKADPKIYNNIVKALKKEGIIPTIKKITKQTDVKIKIKPSVRKVKDVLSVEQKRFGADIKLKEGVAELKLKQFDLIAKKVKPRRKKTTVVKKPKKADTLVVIGKETAVILKRVKTPILKEPVIKKPVVGVKIVRGKSKLKVVPVKPRSKKPSPEAKRPRVKERIITEPVKPKTIQKPKPKIKAKLVPKVRPTVSVLPVSDTKRKTRARPTTKVTQVQDQTRKQLFKPITISVQKTVTKQKLRSGKFKQVVQKVKVPFIPFKLPKKKGKLKVKLTKKDVKPIKLKFTPTISGFDDTPRRKKKEFELFLFTGAEKR